MSIAKISVLVLLGLQPFSVAFADTLSTKWSIKNATSQNVTLYCKNVTQSVMSISLRSQLIAAGASAIYDWGEGYYNDGMGLNPGTWACRATSGAGKSFDLAAFSTGWGETVNLSISYAKGKMVLALVKAPKLMQKKRSSSLKKL